MELQPFEILAIRWHMGKHSFDDGDKQNVEAYKKAFEYEIVKLIAKADHEASHS